MFRKQVNYVVQYECQYVITISTTKKPDCIAAYNKGTSSQVPVSIVAYNVD